jgi:hypothetical protein
LALALALSLLAVSRLKSIDDEEFILVLTLEEEKNMLVDGRLKSIDFRFIKEFVSVIPNGVVVAEVELL